MSKKRQTVYIHPFIPSFRLHAELPLYYYCWKWCWGKALTRRDKLPSSCHIIKKNHFWRRSKKREEITRCNYFFANFYSVVISPLPRDSATTLPGNKKGERKSYFAGALLRVIQKSHLFEIINRMEKVSEPYINVVKNVKRVASWGTGEQFSGERINFKTQWKSESERAHWKQKEKFLNYTSFAATQEVFCLCNEKVLYFYVWMALFKARFSCFFRKMGTWHSNFCSILLFANKNSSSNSFNEKSLSARAKIDVIYQITNPLVNNYH